MRSIIQGFKNTFLDLLKMAAETQPGKPYKSQL